MTEPGAISQRIHNSEYGATRGLGARIGEPGGGVRVWARKETDGALEMPTLLDRDGLDWLMLSFL